MKWGGAKEKKGRGAGIEKFQAASHEVYQGEDPVGQPSLSVPRLVLLGRVWEGQACGALSSPTRGQNPRE